MIVVEQKKIELDYCTSCRGVWFDSGELELLLESMGMESHNLFLNSILNSPEAKSPEKKRKCPICRQKMKKSTIGQQPEVLLDICRKGDGLWFDGGEVGQLIKHLTEKASGKDSAQKVTGFLAEVFKSRA